MSLFDMFRKNKELGDNEVVEAPDNYPDADNVLDWMHQKVSYWAKNKPETLHDLFNPSSGEYLPLAIAVGAGKEAFEENIQDYRALRDQYPQACSKAKSEYRSYVKSSVADPQDFPVEAAS